MPHPATAEHAIHELIAHRWSPRAYADKRVDAKTLRSLLEAARWAPSSYNEQPWYFIVATKDHPQEFQKMLSVLMDANQAWARSAPVLIVSVAAMTWSRNGKPNRHAYHDVGLASALLAVEATSRGLQAHFMAGFDANKAREVFHIPENFEPVAAIAVGYPADAATLSEEIKTKEYAARNRKPQSAFIFSGDWGKPMS